MSSNWAANKCKIDTCIPLFIFVYCFLLILTTFRDKLGMSFVRNSLLDTVGWGRGKLPIENRPVGPIENSGVGLTASSAGNRCRRISLDGTSSADWERGRQTEKRLQSKRRRRRRRWGLSVKPGTLQSSAHVPHMHMKVCAYACVCVSVCALQFGSLGRSVGLIRYRAYRRHRHPRPRLSGASDEAARIKQSNSLYNSMPAGGKGNIMHKERE